MTKYLEDLSPGSLVTAIEENLFEIFKLLGTWDGIEVYDDDEFLWSISDFSSPIFNSVLRAQITAENLEGIIEERKRLCQQRKVPMMWWTGPASSPNQLGKILQKQGFEHSEDNPGMAIDLLSLDTSTSVPASLTFERVKDAESARMSGEILNKSFGAPDFFGGAFADFYMSVGFDEDAPLQNYLGYWKGIPVACSSVFYGAGVAGIYSVGTIPEGRRKGIGKQITLLPLKKARERGCRIGILHASEMGAGVYENIGFREYCKVSHYVWDPEEIEI